MANYRILIADFPYKPNEPETARWIEETIVKLHADPRIGPSGTHRMSVKDTPITMSRNRVLCAAEKNNIDYVLMVDQDMDPDMDTGDEKRKPFWDSSWEFVKDFGKPCCIAAPYCGPPPKENVYAFRWTDSEGHAPGPSHRLEQYTRFEAVQMRGIHQADALATGLILIDMRAVAKLKHPRFYYEWQDTREIQKASTEDVTFSRDLRLVKIPLFVNWDAWAGHWKPKCVGKPEFCGADSVSDHLREGLLAAGKPTTAAVDSPPAERTRLDDYIVKGPNGFEYQPK